VAVLSQDAFVQYVATSLDLQQAPRPDEVVWDAGIDSALLIELVFAIEDLGVVLPDDLEWEKMTLADLHKEYAVRIAT
jgi:acyl carrier protein